MSCVLMTAAPCQATFAARCGTVAYVLAAMCGPTAAAYIIATALTNLSSTKPQAAGNASYGTVYAAFEAAMFGQTAAAFITAAVHGVSARSSFLTRARTHGPA